MPLQLLIDLVRDQIGLGNEHRERLLRFLPTAETANSPPVRYRDHELNRRIQEPAVVLSRQEPGDGAQPDRLPPEQFFPVPFQECSQKLRLAPRLLDRGGHPYLPALVHAAPLIPARVIGPDSYLLRHRLALDDEHPPAMHDQVIDLAHPGRAVLLGLLAILEPQTVQHMSLRIVVETAVQVVRHLPLGFDAGSKTRIGGCDLLLVRLFGHLECRRQGCHGVLRQTRAGRPPTSATVRVNRRPSR